jgi:hypothetical protein
MNGCLIDWTSETYHECALDVTLNRIQQDKVLVGSNARRIGFAELDVFLKGELFSMNVIPR